MRYIILVLLNVPIIFLALLNIITNYKLGRIPRERFVRHLLLWVVILVILIGSFPMYNYLLGKDVLDSTDLSLFDIAEITAIVMLFYFLNHLRQRTDFIEKRMKDLHQELSIRLSDK